MYSITQGKEEDHHSQYWCVSARLGEREIECECVRDRETEKEIGNLCYINAHVVRVRLLFPFYISSLYAC